MKKFILSLAVALCATTAAMAEVSVSGGADLVSNYNWRGIQQSGPAIQPGMSVSFGNFSVGAWGSQAFDATATTTREMDFTIGYEVGGFSISVTDYWWNGEIAGVDDDGCNIAPNYFKDKGHQQEVTVGYGFDCGFSLSWSTMVNGDNDKDEDGQMYSSYIALGYSCEIAETVGCDISVGINPWDSQWGKCGLSTVGVRFSKDFLNSDKISLPIFVETSFSQVTENAYLVAGLSFGF